MSDNLLDIRNLVVEYHTAEGVAQAINGLNLQVNRGEALGLVGESGAGKTTTALSILRLLPEMTGRIKAGEIYYQGKDLLQESEENLQKIRGNKIAMIFQNPLTSLNPVFTVGEQIAVAFRLHQNLKPKEAMEKARKMLEIVGIHGDRAKEYPHQFSGGMRQRVGIAAALACNPELLIADEPTTALDVTIQAQVLDLMENLQKSYGMSMIMITHNLGIVAETCEKVAVMYAGQIVEYGTVQQVFHSPKHPYTQGLFGAIPTNDVSQTRLKPVPGTTPNAMRLPKGCKFSSRCPMACEACLKGEPRSRALRPDHWVSCFNVKEGEKGV